MMGDKINKYIKKVVDDTPEGDDKDMLKRMLDSENETPWFFKKKSSFKEVNKRMEEIEDGAKED